MYPFSKISDFPCDSWNKLDETNDLFLKSELSDTIDLEDLQKIITDPYTVLSGLYTSNKTNLASMYSTIINREQNISSFWKFESGTESSKIIEHYVLGNFFEEFFAKSKAAVNGVIALSGDYANHFHMLPLEEILTHFRTSQLSDSNGENFYTLNNYTYSNNPSQNPFLEINLSNVKHFDANKFNGTISALINDGKFVIGIKDLTDQSDTSKMSNTVTESLTSQAAKNKNALTIKIQPKAKSDRLKNLTPKEYIVKVGCDWHEKVPEDPEHPKNYHYERRWTLRTVVDSTTIDQRTFATAEYTNRLFAMVFDSLRDIIERLVRILIDFTSNTYYIPSYVGQIVQGTKGMASENDLKKLYGDGSPIFSLAGLTVKKPATHWIQHSGEYSFKAAKSDVSFNKKSIDGGDNAVRRVMNTEMPAHSHSVNAHSHGKSSVKVSGNGSKFILSFSPHPDMSDGGSDGKCSTCDFYTTGKVWFGVKSVSVGDSENITASNTGKDTYTNFDIQQATKNCFAWERVS